MTKKLCHGFTVKIASPFKVKQENSTAKIGKRCTAVVIKDDNELKARLITFPVEECDEFRVLPFTEESFSLKGKTTVFAKHKDEYGHRICIMRDSLKVNHSPGLQSQFDALSEGLVIYGHIIRKNKKHYFNYESIKAFREHFKPVTEKDFIDFEV